ncbi:MAG: 5-formyltetrahydrofolate cyclo-ligase [Coriobacteriia bacterium]
MEDGPKNALRKEARETLRAMPREVRARESAEIAERVLSLPELARARTVLAYAALPEEPDLATAFALLRERGTAVAYPRVTGPRALTLHVASETDLAPGTYGILEPAADAPVMAADGLDAVVLPGLAFDRSGVRLGHGGGFYDTLLADLPPHVARIGVAFDAQVRETLPREEHDALVDVVVTATVVYRRSDRKR